MAAVALKPRDNAESGQPCLRGGLTLARGDDPAGAKQEPGGLDAPGVGPWEEDSGDRPQSLALLGTLASCRWPSLGPPVPPGFPPREGSGSWWWSTEAQSYLGPGPVGLLWRG